MAPGDIFEAEPERIAAGGAGLARPGGQAVFIPYAAPGDRLRCRVMRDHGPWAEAEILDIIRPSPRRVEPRCPLYPPAGPAGPEHCGGCSLQHLGYDAQLEAKEAIVREAFDRIARIPAGDITVTPSPPWEYRNRIQLHRGPGAPGFKSAAGAGLVPLGDCPVAEAGIRALLRSGSLRAPAGRDRFTLYGRGEFSVLEGGRSRGKLKIRDREILMDAGVFFQSNAAALELLIGEILDFIRNPGLKTGAPLADLYCGVGTFAAFLADRFPRIDLLEENPLALTLARGNVPPEEARFFAMTDNEWVRKKERERPPGEYGLIIADPPRRGLSPAMRRWLGRAPAPVLLYVSCDPATLARDSGELSKGWDLAALKLFDFYPQTAHIECLAVFTRKHGN
jgi:23S rRNA (uracil1939-C5)-methyltransferase